jgi:transposase InsO family protein
VSEWPGLRRWHVTVTRGSQFTGAAFTGVLTAAGINISMDALGRGWTRVRRTAVALA